MGNLERYGMSPETAVLLKRRSDYRKDLQAFLHNAQPGDPRLLVLNDLADQIEVENPFPVSETLSAYLSTDEYSEEIKTRKQTIMGVITTRETLLPKYKGARASLLNDQLDREIIATEKALLPPLPLERRSSADALAAYVAAAQIREITRGVRASFRVAPTRSINS